MRSSAGVRTAAPTRAPARHSPVRGHRRGGTQGTGSCRALRAFGRPPTSLGRWSWRRRGREPSPRALARRRSGRERGLRSSRAEGAPAFPPFGRYAWRLRPRPKQPLQLLWEPLPEPPGRESVATECCHRPRRRRSRRPERPRSLTSGAGPAPFPSRDLRRRGGAASSRGARREARGDNWRRVASARAAPPPPCSPWPAPPPVAAEPSFRGVVAPSLPGLRRPPRALRVATGTTRPPRRGRG